MLRWFLIDGNTETSLLLLVDCWFLRVVHSGQVTFLGRIGKVLGEKVEIHFGLIFLNCCEYELFLWVVNSLSLFFVQMFGIGSLSLRVILCHPYCLVF